MPENDFADRHNKSLPKTTRKHRKGRLSCFQPSNPGLLIRHRPKYLQQAYHQLHPFGENKHIGRVDELPITTFIRLLVS